MLNSSNIHRLWGIFVVDYLTHLIHHCKIICSTRMAKSIPLPLLSSEVSPSTETISLMTLRSSTYSATSFQNGSATPSRSVTPIKGADRPKPAKKRASRACVACHVRKVRCDVTKKHPFVANRKVVCSNCALDGIECVMRECRRMRLVVWSHRQCLIC